MYSGVKTITEELMVGSDEVSVQPQIVKPEATEITEPVANPVEVQQEKNDEGMVMIVEEVTPVRHQQPPENNRKPKPKPSYMKYVA